MKREKPYFKRKGPLLLSLLLVLSLAISSISTYAAPAADSPLTEAEIALIESVDYDTVVSHVKKLSGDIGVTVAGNPSEKHRADYIAGVFEDIGLEPWYYATSPDGVADYFQTIENDTGVTNIIGGSITVAGHEYPANAPNWSATSVYRGHEKPLVTGDTVYFPTVAEAVAASPASIAGKIVLTHRNSATFAPDVRVLEGNGALAVVFFYNKYTVNADGKTSSESRFAAPTTGSNINIPVILTSYFDGQAILKALLNDAGVVGSSNVTVVNRRNTTTQNIIAIKKAVEPTDKFVLIGAHYDTVFGSPGVNDNTSGTASVLGIAEAIKDIPTRYNVIFGIWGAEEAGLRGSRYFYSNTLVPGAYYKNGISYFNLDMAATSQIGYGKLTIHTPFRTSTNQPIKSTAGELFEKQAARYWAYSGNKWGDWWKEGVDLEYYGNCSDHASIAGANQGGSASDAIPQVYVFWGNDTPGTGTTEYNYHVTGDRYDWPGDPFKIRGDDDYYTGNYSVERAEILASINALSVYEAAKAIADPYVASYISGGAIIGNFVNYSDESRSGQLVAAVYDASGKLVKIKNAAFSSLPGETAKIELSLSEVNEGYSYQIFGWNDFFIPLADPSSGSIAKTDVPSPADNVNVFISPRVESDGLSEHVHEHDIAA
ncbi:hypothetical protein FACS1894127_4900 [Clostridia bacterium]|nr:hypothetical protein FACS1894127_4900 [Clostridia bacterium]